MLLFVNACFRNESRTERLARAWLRRHDHGDKIVELALAKASVAPLDAGGPSPIGEYGNAVATTTYDHPMFDFAKQFAQAGEIVVAAPVWNYALPAKLHDYLELVCSQGVTFDIDGAGEYVGLCKARRLTLVTTAGGIAPAPEDDHAFGYVRTLARRFWHIPQVDLVACWGMDAPGTDVDALIANALA